MRKSLVRFKYYTLFSYTIIFFLSLGKSAFATNEQPIPTPYVKCNETRTPEWHSLRPYQASPCEVPIKEEEQSLLCGNTIFIKDTIKHPSDPNTCLDCLPPPCCGCTVERHFKAPREFIVALNAFESELPIAGNTELIPPEKTSALSKIFGGLETAKRLTEWKNHLPPDPSKYDNLQEYYKDYQNWRGKTCAEFKIPIINIEILFCFNDPTKPDYWAALFPYIPYSSTEDRIGKAYVYDMVYRGGNVDYIDPNPPITNWNPSLNSSDPRHQKIKENETPLYFPHMEENNELISLLQSTYISESLKKEEQKIKDTEPVNIAANCKILDVRYNPGDQLFGEKKDDELGIPNANVKYDAYYRCLVEYPPEPFCFFYRKLPCTYHTRFSSNVETFTPMVEELFSKTVAGNMSVFRKIFPKVESGSVIEKIKDIPASTQVVHQSKDIISNTNVESMPAEFYIPHFGSIYDYFLMGVQSALRPKEFPGQPAGLSRGQPIPEADRANEYLSWYLNGTLFRAESDPLSHKDQNDIKRLTTLSGPLNKLLPQEIQWRNKVTSDVLNSQRDKTQKTGRVDEVTPRAKKDRHDQIVACTIEKKIFGWIPKWMPIIGGGITIGGIPTACSEKSIASMGQDFGSPSPSTPPTPGASSCPDVPDTQVNPKYLGSMKQNFQRMASTYGNCDLVEECYNYVVSESEKAGVNPALTLTLWLHESGASSYCKNPGVEDFGVHYIPGQDIVGQLQEWLKIGKSGAACNWCYNKYPTQWKEPMQAFLYVYRFGAGDCNPSGDQGFYNDMVQMFQWVVDPIAYCLDSNGGFKISCSNDMSCP